MKLKLIYESKLEFSYQSLGKEKWLELLYEYQKDNNISFNTENNDYVSDVFKLDINNNSILCQAWMAGGDWETPILYYTCQVIDGDIKYNHPMFIFIPIKGNKNFIKKDGKYIPIQDSSAEYERQNESDCRKELKEFINEISNDSNSSDDD